MSTTSLLAYGHKTHYIKETRGGINNVKSFKFIDISRFSHEKLSSDIWTANRNPIAGQNRIPIASQIQAQMT